MTEYSFEDIVYVDDIDTEVLDDNMATTMEIEESVSNTNQTNLAIAETLEALMPGSIINHMPLNSFTKDLSPTNVNVTLEGVKETFKYLKEEIFLKLFEAIKKAIRWVIDNLFPEKTNKTEKAKEAASAASSAKKDYDSKKKDKTAPVVDEVTKDTKIRKPFAEALADAIKEDVANNSDKPFKSTGTNAASILEEISDHYGKQEFNGKISQFLSDVLVKGQAGQLAAGYELVTLAGKQVPELYDFAYDINEAMHDSETVPVMSNFDKYATGDRYMEKLGAFKAIPLTKGDTFTDTMANFTKALGEYITPNEKYNLSSMNELNFEVTMACFDAVNMEKAREMSRKLLKLLPIVTDLENEVKKIDEQFIKHFLDPVRMLRTEVMDVLAVCAVADRLETKIGQFSQYYAKVIERMDKVVDKALKQIYNDLQDEEAKTKVKEYVKS